MLIPLNDIVGKAKGIQRDPSFIYIDSVVIKNKSLVFNYINSNDFAVRPDHILAKILQSLSINTNATDDVIYSNVKSRTDSLASSMRLTCPSYVGAPLTGQFVNGCTEYIWASKREFDLNTPWVDLEPIKFIYHTNTNVNFRLGYSNPDENSDAFIEINIPMLAIQYANWRRDCARRGLSSNIVNFIVKYPFKNALLSYTDISQFNRHYYRIVGKPIRTEEKFGPILINNVEHLLDKSNLNIISYITNGAKTITQTLHYVPLFFHNSIIDIINIPEQSTREVNWFLDVAQMPYIDFALAANTTSDGGLDKKLLSNMERDLYALNSSRVIQRLPVAYRNSIQTNYIDNLYDRINSFR